MRVDDPQGIALIDKPTGPTSHDVVARARKALGTKKVGHAGTLDPMATGLLVLGVGRGTKLLTFLVGADKTYTATIRLGAATTTDDAEGELLTQGDSAALAGITDGQLGTEVAALTGQIQQVPSAVSAIKVAGQRAYTRVRAGEQVELAARTVSVYRFEILTTRRDGEWLDLEVEVDVSSGTYIRALARDLGAALGVGGHLTALRRTRVAPFEVSQAAALAAFQAEPTLLDLAQAARLIMPVREVDPEQADALRHGRRLRSLDFGDRPHAAIDQDGALVAVLTEAGPVSRPLVVLS